MRRARSKSLAPMAWATCTENPIEAAASKPLNSHVDDSTKPMDADWRAPRLPTIDASMKNITMADICESIDGTLSWAISRSFSPRVMVRPSRMYDNSSSPLFFPNIELPFSLFAMKFTPHACRHRRPEGRAARSRHAPPFMAGMQNYSFYSFPATVLVEKTVGGPRRRPYPARPGRPVCQRPTDLPAS